MHFSPSSIDWQDFSKSVRAFALGLFCIDYLKMINRTFKIITVRLELRRLALSPALDKVKTLLQENLMLASSIGHDLDLSLSTTIKDLFYF